MNNQFIKTMHSSKEYHENKDYIGSTSLKKYLQSPTHYLYNKNNPKPPSEEMSFGSAYHILILEEDKWNDEVFVLDESKRPMPDKDYRTKENRDWKDEQIKSSVGKIYLSMEQYDTAMRMRDVLKQNTFASDLMNGEERESSYYGEYNGVKVKVRPDSYTKGKFIADLKTCQDSSFEEFKKHSFNMGYHISASLYLDILNITNNPDTEEGFFFVSQEKKPPYNVSVFIASEQFIAQGRHIYENLLRLHKHCLEKNEWKGYEVFSEFQNNVQVLDIPSWGMKELIINI